MGIQIRKFVDKETANELLRNLIDGVYFAFTCWWCGAEVDAGAKHRHNCPYAIACEALGHSRQGTIREPAIHCHNCGQDVSPGEPPAERRSIG